MDSIDQRMLFVYGTLRQHTSHAMARLVARRARFVDSASFRGRLFMVQQYPGAVPSDDPNDVVHGEVYELEQPQRTLALLDEYEGYDPRARGCLFLRREYPVTLASGATLQAWVYVYNKETRGLARIPSGDFSRPAG